MILNGFNEVLYKEKAESLVKGSRIRERDKKSAEYYVGDYWTYTTKRQMKIELQKRYRKIMRF